MQINDLGDVTKAINKSITASFFVILLLSMAILNGVYYLYQHNRKQMMLQKIDATFLLFSARLSEKLSIIASSNTFIDFLRSGEISRSILLPQFLFETHDLMSKAVAGMKLFNSGKQMIFSGGVETNDMLALDICYLNKRLDSYSGDCTHRWELYLNKKEVLKELEKINPELMTCASCVGQPMLKESYFGNFPVSRMSGLDFNLAIKDSGTRLFLFINIFIAIILLTLTILNIKKIKKIFKVNLFIPISEITAGIRDKVTLPKENTIKELSYLVSQIEGWKAQLIELEEAKAREQVKEQEEKIKVMQSVGASIAHELRTPLRSIMSGVSGIEKFLPILLKSYDEAKKAGSITEIIGPHQIELLRRVLTNLKSEGLSANIVIDMFLMKIRGAITDLSTIRLLSIADCVNNALKRYAFQDVERDLVDYDGANNFQFKGDAILVVHILFNLLKNALYYVASASKGKIYIRFENKEKENRMYFKDTGKGITKEVLPNIFNKFYSQTEGGVGIGLSFCKMAMEWMGGDITCQSVEGEYTEFILHFPKLGE